MYKIFFILALILLGCEEATVENGERVIDDRSSSYHESCIGGHVYYESGHQLAPRLNDDGTPVKCKKIIKNK